MLLTGREVAKCVLFVSLSLMEPHQLRSLQPFQLESTCARCWSSSSNVTENKFAVYPTGRSNRRHFLQQAFSPYHRYVTQSVTLHCLPRNKQQKLMFLWLYKWSWPLFNWLFLKQKHHLKFSRFSWNFQSSRLVASAQTEVTWTVVTSENQY